MKIFILLLLVTSVEATDHARNLQQQAARVAQTMAPDTLPNFGTSLPKESALNDIHALEAAGETALSAPHAQGIADMAQTRPYFVIDSSTDPLFKNAQQAIEEPERVLTSPLYNGGSKMIYEEKTCRESKSLTGLTCQKSLLLPTVQIEPAQYSHFWCSQGNHAPDDPRCKAQTYYEPARKYKEEVVTLQPEKWVSTCQRLQEKERKGFCRLVKTDCPEGAQTKYIKAPIGDTGQTDSRPITKPCWRYEYTYECQQKSVNTCAALRQSACEQIQSRCLHTKGPDYIEWEQTYRCPVGVLEEEREPVSGGGMELPKAPSPLSPTANPDMAEVLSKLSIFQDIQREMQAHPTVETMAVFRGTSRSCTLPFYGFKNCCRGGKGWGVSLGLSSCSAEEKDMATCQRQGRCVDLGSYCAERLLGSCIRRKSAACCFPTKLSRIVQEQGRAQLGLEWGSPEQPQCRGLTPEELAKIDFDKLDLSDIFTEVANRAKTIPSKKIQSTFSKRLTQRVREGAPPGRAGVQ